MRIDIESRIYETPTAVIYAVQVGDRIDRIEYHDITGLAIIEELLGGAEKKLKDTIEVDWSKNGF